ncbi:hypothetical protein [Micromonospora rosaria]|uniref:hypothetical protein n=1 Tax=Micromonospora rosaria TaxID=47874 RepID=UPI000A6C8915|nr:hypothetical protein [Micromonospora rosaria]
MPHQADPPAPEHTSPAPGSEATRYLCAAAHTDPTFTRRTLAEIFDDDLRAVAPSVGFDLPTVLRHCLWARRRRRARDAWLLLTGGAALLISPLWTVLAGLAMLVAGALTPHRDTRTGLARALLGLVGGALAAVLLLGQLRQVAATDEPGSLAAWLVGRPLLALPFGVAAYLVLVLHLLGTRWLLATRLRRGRVQPPERPATGEGRHAARLAAVESAQHGNVTVYRGYDPFVGYGDPVAGWSFALPLVAAEPVVGLPAGPAASVAFPVVDLIDHVRDHLATVRLDPGGSDLPGGLLLQDRVFVGGRLLTGDSRLLPDRERMPRQRWSDEQVRQVAEQPRGAARHYLCALVPSWGGEVVAGTFLHFSTDGRVLYLECARTVLQPPRLGYHDVDRLTEWLPASHLAQVLSTGGATLLRTAAGAPGRLLVDLLDAARHERRQSRRRRLAREDLGYDYGAEVGVREVAAGADYHNYFQVLDAAKHLKVVERHVLAAIVGFLDARGVDTTEFRTRQTTILNQGVIQTGGLSVVGNQAVGTGARAEQATEAGSDAPRQRRES